MPLLTVRIQLPSIISGSSTNSKFRHNSQFRAAIPNLKAGTTWVEFVRIRPPGLLKSGRYETVFPLD